MVNYKNAMIVFRAPFSPLKHFYYIVHNMSIEKNENINGSKTPLKAHRKEKGTFGYYATNMPEKSL